MQLALEANVAELKVTVLAPATACKAPLVQFVLALGVSATAKPDGKVTGTDSPVKEAPWSRLLTLTVSVELPPCVTELGAYDNDAVGASITRKEAPADRAFWYPPELVTALAGKVVVSNPEALAVTLTCTVQLDPAASCPPLRLKLLLVTETSPPVQVVDGLGVATMDMPAGSVWVKLRFVSRLLTELVICTVSTELCPGAMYAGEKPIPALMLCKLVSVAVALEVLV